MQQGAERRGEARRRRPTPFSPLLLAAPLRDGGLKEERRLRRGHLRKMDEKIAAGAGRAADGRRIPNRASEFYTSRQFRRNFLAAFASHVVLGHGEEARYRRDKQLQPPGQSA